MSRNAVLILILALGLGVVFFIAGSSDAAEPTGDTFYQWTTDGGDVSTTDDPKRIPAKYRDVAIERSFAQVGKDAKVTEMVIPAAEYQAQLEASLERLRRLAARTTTSPRIEGCDGPITVAQERHDYEERGNSYNSLFYVVKDACGNVKSVTRSNPRLLVVPVQ
jgi:hypothetical protein